MSQEVAFEYLLQASETTRGTAITTPEKYLNMKGTLKPMAEVWMPEESDGTLSMARRSAFTRRWAEFEGEGPLDPNTAARLFALGLKGVPVTAVVVAGQVWTHTFDRDMTSDTIKSSTLWFGDPSTLILRAPYGMVDTIEIDADGTGTDGSTISVNGFAQQESKIAAPTAPAQVAPLAIVPGGIQVWLDTSSPYGTTEITSRVLSINHSIPTGNVAKYGPNGSATNPLTFRRTGRKKAQPVTTISLELIDSNQYDLFNSQAGQPVKLRVRHNTIAPINGANYGYIQVDTYGPLSGLDWDTYEDANRVVSFEIPAIYDPTLATDFRAIVQTNSATI